MGLSWLISVTCGHTKRITTNTIVLIGYCCGNAIGPLMWEKRYKPRCVHHAKFGVIISTFDCRNTVPWGVIIGCYSSCLLLLLGIRLYLARENRRRDRESPQVDGYDQVYMSKEIDGNTVEFKVDKVCTILVFCTGSNQFRRRSSWI